MDNTPFPARFPTFGRVFPGPQDEHGLVKVPDILQTLYPTFFKLNTPHCNDVRISIGKLFLGPLMTESLRGQTNDLVSLANTRISHFSEAFQLERGHWEWRGRIQTLDYNSGWDGHRLCEDFVTDGVGFSHQDVWILGIGQPDVEGADVTASDAPPYSQVDPNTCDPESGDVGIAVGCLVAKYKQENPDADLSELAQPEWITKGFHPKTVGFRDIRDQIHERWFSASSEPPGPSSGRLHHLWIREYECGWLPEFIP